MEINHLLKLNTQNIYQSTKNITRNEVISKNFDCTKSPVNPHYYKTYHGVSFCGIAKNQKEETNIINFITTLSNIEKTDSDFMKADLTKEGIKVDLTYPRAKFMQDVDKELSQLSQEEKNNVTEYFGFNLKKDEENRLIMTGYPKDSDIPVKNENIKNAIKNIKPLVKDFSEINEILPNETITEEMANDLNNIINIFPELNTTIGKIQHRTHSYTVDVHSLNVLQNIMKNSEYKELPENDRRTLQIATLFHDLTKKEYTVDKTHPRCSAEDSYPIIARLGLPEKQHEQIHKIIKNHDFLERYSESTADEFATQLKDDNSLKMMCILTDADLKSVARDGNFHQKYAPMIPFAREDAEEHIKNLK